jgi:hypothetical protein
LKGNMPKTTKQSKSAPLSAKTTTTATIEEQWGRVRELLGNLKPGELTADSKQYTLTGGALEALQLAAKLKDQPFETFAREYLNGLIRRDIQDGAGDSARGLRDWLATVKELPANGKLTLQVTLSLDVRNWNFVAHAMHTRKLSLDELISEVLSTGADTADMDEPVKD